MKNVHVVIEVRSINRHKRNNHSSARHIANLAALIAALKAIEVDNVKGPSTACDILLHDKLSIKILLLLLIPYCIEGRKAVVYVALQ